jgi:hypothetical protein
MVNIRTEQNTYLFLKDIYGEMENKFIFVFAESGYGKSLFCEAIMEEYKKAGYTVIILADVKGEVESGFAMFKTKKRYHLEFLRKIGKPVDPLNVKLYHPFTFNIPKNTSLPEFNFYGISLKDLKREEWAMLAESMSDSDTIRLLLNTCQNMARTDGLYTFLHTIEESVLGRKEKRTFKPDPKNFFLRSTPATGKSLQDVSSYLMPFKYDYFLVADTSPIKLNWANILNDNSSYHAFCSLWIKDEKIKQFCILNVLNSIVDNLKYAKKPILIVIPEIRKLTPFKPEGYAKFLAESIKSKLTILRNMGKGVSGLFDSQIWGDVDEDVRNSSTTTFYGKMGGAGDIEKIAKARNYKREIRDQLSNMEVRGSYLLQGHEDLGAFIGWMPGHSHKEPEFNFFEEYKDTFPERMKEYNSLIELMKNNLKEEEDKIKEKIKNRIKEEKEAEDAIREKRSEKSNEKVEKLKEEKKNIIDQSKLDKMRLLYEDKIKDPNLSFRVLGKKYGINNHTAKNWFDQTKIKMEGEKKLEDTKDYETKVLEDLNKSKEEISSGNQGLPDLPDKDNVQDI